MTRTLRLLALAVALPLALSACNTGGKAGDTNVESGSAKALEPNNKPSRTSADNGDAMSQTTANADSLTAGLARDTTNRPTGKQLYNAADRAKDRNHDGIAD
jgi:predicted small secreted protein